MYQSIIFINTPASNYVVFSAIRIFFYFQTIRKVLRNVYKMLYFAAVFVIFHEIMLYLVPNFCTNLRYRTFNFRTNFCALRDYNIVK